MGGTTSLSWSDADQQPAAPPPAPQPAARPAPPARRAAPAPKQAQGIDWSQYQEVPAQAAPSQAAAAPAGQAAGIDWGSYKDVPVPTQGIAERFARSANAVAGGVEDPNQLMDQLRQLFNPNDPRYDPTYFDHPEKAYWEMLKGIHQGMQQTWQRADQEWEAGNWSSAQGLINKADALIHYVWSGIPMGGAVLTKAEDQFKAGDIAGGLGTMTGLLGPMIMGDVGTGVYKGPESFKAPPLGQEFRQGARNVIAAQGENIGQVTGGLYGLATGGPSGGVAGYVLGGKVGRILQERAARVPEAPTTNDLAAAIRQQYGNNIPVSGAAVPGAIYQEIHRADPTLSDTQIRGIAEDVMRERPRPAARRPAAAPAPPAAAPTAAAPPEAPGAAAAAPGYTEGGGQPEQQPAAGPAPSEPQAAAPAEQRGVAAAGAGESPYAYTRRGAGDPAGVRSVLGLPVVESWSLAPEKVTELQAKGYQSPDLHEVDASHPDAAQTFQNQIAQTKVGNKYAASVHVYTPEEYAQTRMFLTEDGKAGFALKPDGDIVSVFVHGNGPKGAVHTMMEIAKQAGGNKLDAFDTVLPEIYGNHGFTAVARIPWSDEFAPEGWNKQTFGKYNGGEPDVVFMARNPDAVPYKPGDGAPVADYDQAVRTQQMAVDKFEAPEEPAAAAPAPEEAAAPAVKPKWETHEELSQKLFNEPYKTLVGMYGKAGARERLQPYYETQERLWAKKQGVPTGTDKAALRNLGWSEGEINRLNYDQAEEAVARRAGPEEAPPPEAAAPATLKEQLEQSLKEPGGFGADNKIFTREVHDEGVRELDEATDPSKMHAGADILPAISAATKIGGFYFEGGLRDFADWSERMLEHGEWLRPYLNQIYRGVSDEAQNYKDNISTRMPTSEAFGKFRGEEVKVIPSEDPYRNQLRVDTDAVLRRDPVQAGKLSDIVQKKTELTEPKMMDRTKDGELKYETMGEFQDAHNQWKDDMENQYRGVTIDPKIADDPKAVFDSFKDQMKRNLRKLYEFVPENIRGITAQWYDTVRQKVVAQAEKYGLENRQVAAVYASLSPQKDWFMNNSLGDRVMDIWHNQQDATFDDEMQTKLNQLTQKGKNKALGKIADTFGDKTFAEMDTTQQAVFARLWDEAHNDRSYNAITPDGQDLGPVMKKGKGKKVLNPDTGKMEVPPVPANVAWGGIRDIRKAIEVLRDGSIENVQAQLMGSHKVPNFYNNILTPNHPGEYVTIDTHAVAAALLRPLSGKALEVAQNFGSAGSVRSGVDGTYPLYADSYRELAQELGIQPRQLQSITWEAIRDIFPAKWKMDPANIAKINRIWKEFEDGASFDETFDKILDARGGKNVEWSAGRRSSRMAEETEDAGDVEELR